jgi:hypothetical protein
MLLSVGKLPLGMIKSRQVQFHSIAVEIKSEAKKRLSSEAYKHFLSVLILILKKRA